MSNDKLKEITDIYEKLGINDVDSIKTTFNTVELDGRNFYKSTENNNVIVHVSSVDK